MDGQKGAKISSKRGFNPFVVDKSTNWRDARRKDQLSELAVRRAERRKPVHEQHTYVTRTQGGNIPRIRKEIQKMCDRVPSEGSIDFWEKIKEKKSPMEERNEADRQNSRELIQFKREIFRLGFSLQIRRNEIDKLKFRALIADKRMEGAEQRLLNDMQLFDEFLHSTNKAASDAMKVADQESKRHEQKVKKIKALNAQICEVRSDICRLEDTFEFKDMIKQFIFLVHWNQSRPDNKPLVISSDKWKNVWKDIAPNCGDIPFVNPHQLCEKIEELEDRNLSLIGHFQQSEEECEEIKQHFKLTESKLAAQIDQLRSHMEVINSTVERNISRAEELKFCCKMFDNGDGFNDQEEQLKSLENVIQRVYNETIGSHNVDMHVDSLTMLTFIETRLEDLIEAEEHLPKSLVKELQKEQDKNRRIKAREQKVINQEAAQKERAKRARNRNNADHSKRIGRKLINRSRPVQKELEKKLSLDIIEDRDAEFFTY